MTPKDVSRMLIPMPTESQFHAFKSVLEERKEKVASTYDIVSEWVKGFSLGSEAAAEIDQHLQNAWDALKSSNDGIDDLKEESQRRAEQCRLHREAVQYWWYNLQPDERTWDSWGERPRPSETFIDLDWEPPYVNS